jgi:membrane-associated protease RseP (regulator of RpoE activity)
MNIFLSWNLNTFWSLILFFVALGVLVSIHELGHFIAAKIFKVYCSDFSIGFGPEIFHIKRKKGETRFSVRVLPLGGYVSMFATEDDLPDGVKLGKDRSLEGKKRWQRIIIMIAGITMNFVLAYILFFIGASCFPQYQTSLRTLVHSEDSVVRSTLKIEDDEGYYTEDFLDYDEVLVDEYSYVASDNESHSIYLIEGSKFDIGGDSYVAILDMSSFAIYDNDFAQYIALYKGDVYDASIYTNDGTEEVQNVFLPTFLSDSKLTPSLGGNDLSVPLKLTRESEDSTSISLNGLLTLKQEDGYFASFGGVFYQAKVRLGVNAFATSGSLWVRSTTLIAEAITRLFIGQGWNQVSGPVSLFTTTTSMLLNNPFYIYLNLWGMISVNLALFNLLPFPGLDGWQILVELIEGSVNGIKKAKFKRKKKDDKSSKISLHGESVSLEKGAELTIGDQSTYVEWKIPAKVKSIVSYIGIGILLLFSIFIILKEIIGLF